MLQLAAAMGLAFSVCLISFHVFSPRPRSGARKTFTDWTSSARNRLASLNLRWMPKIYQRWLQRRLLYAGEPPGLRAEDMVGLQELAGVLVLALSCMVAHRFGLPWMWCLPGPVLGAVLPLSWLRDRIQKRHAQIARALPYSLDLLTLAVEAGLDFTAAFVRVVEKGKPGPLRDEMRRLLNELKMGIPREEGLRKMALRVGLPAVNQFAMALIQADRLGTPLGKVLRLQSAQLRLVRTQRAEKLAGEAPVKMLFPLIACIFPTVFLILFGPIVFAYIFGALGAP